MVHFCLPFHLLNFFPKIHSEVTEKKNLQASFVVYATQISSHELEELKVYSLLAKVPHCLERAPELLGSGFAKSMLGCVTRLDLLPKLPC